MRMRPEPSLTVSIWETSPVKELVSHQCPRQNNAIQCNVASHRADVPSVRQTGKESEGRFGWR